MTAGPRGQAAEGNGPEAGSHGTEAGFATGGTHGTADLRAADPGLADREVHDRMLAHGSPPARLLRQLITS